MHRTMSFSENKTYELWISFMPRRHEILNAIGTAYYSIQFYSPSFFNVFTPQASFTKWAALEVADVNHIPEGMEPVMIPAGRYAVFIYRGDAQNASPFYQYIFSTWLPNSGYELDHRPHFEILGDKYRRDDPGSEEEVWIPVK